VWSSQQAAAVLAPRAGSRALHVSGSLPPGPLGQRNALTVRCNGAQVGEVVNPWEETMPFGLDFPIPAGQPWSWSLEFRTSFVFRPCERGQGPDQRDLGFALALVVSKQLEDGRAVARRARTLRPLRYAIGALDALGRLAAAIAPRRRRNALPESRPGLSVVIPEWDNVEELTACLAGVREAAKLWQEPIETIVVVNGSPAAEYKALRAAHPLVRWQFHARPLGFCGAVAAGLRAARFDWVYLLNNDAVLDPGALLAAGRLRENATFAVASQIALKDPTRFRDETNWSTLFLENSLATIHDLIPRTGRTRDTFYAGGGASLFRACVLRSLLDVSAYQPFYWEDVEWGWRARKLGLRAVFCPDSVACHTRRSTIARRYTAQEIEMALRRNRLLFQLRNLTGKGLAGRALDEAARSPGLVADAFLEWPTLWKIARGRWWNYRAPVSDDEVLSAGPAAERCANSG
jgi:GT2 family glycosyltransferase